jgi:hypothetical protein
VEVIECRANFTRERYGGRAEIKDSGAIRGGMRIERENQITKALDVVETVSEAIKATVKAGIEEDRPTIR